MGNSIDSALARLAPPEAVRLQVLAHLFLARVHDLVKSSYDQFLQAYATSMIDYELEPIRPITWLGEDHLQQGPVELSRRPTQSSVGVLVNRKRRNKVQVHRAGPSYSTTTIEDFSAMDETPHGYARERQHLWDWQGFPALWRPFAIYDWAATRWMTWASLRALSRDQLGALVSPLSQRLFGLPGNCLLLGSLATPVAVSHLASLVLSSFHLCWHLVQDYAKQKRVITVIVFLMASERDIGHAYDQLLVAQQTVDNQSTSRDESEQLCLFRAVMCYRVHRYQRVYFKLRPNRTREARENLKARTALVTLITLAFFGFLFLVASTLIWLALLSDYRYAHVYPGCYPLLDEQLARGQLSLFSVTLWNHHLLSILFDFTENFFIWLNSGLSITFVPAFTYLLNYDLLLYWSALNRKLLMLAQRSKRFYLMRLVADGAGHSHDHDDDHDDDDDDKDNDHDHNHHDHDDENGGVDRPQQYNSALTNVIKIREYPLSRTLEADMHELQCEMFDFFHQLQRADLFIGDVLTAAIIIWLTGCGFVTYNQLTYNDASLPSLVVELVLLLSFFVITLATYHLLELRRQCLRSYPVLCSLIAYEPTRRKMQFTKILNFYLDNSTSYHLCRTYAYKPTTFITIIGWTFSCFIIASTLFKPAQ